MNTFIDSTFGPLNKDYCNWFYILSILGFIFVCVLLLSTLLIGLRKKKGFEFYLTNIFVISVYVAFYFQNRLLYSMCYSSLE